MVFKDINTAYQYLSKPLTKVIYDEFGVLGLAMYEEEKKKFMELQEEIRLATQLVDAELDAADEQTKRRLQKQVREQKASVENKILNESRRLLKEKMKMHELQKYNKVFKIDFGIDAKSFCNYYHDFHTHGAFWDSLSLIKGRHLNYTGHVKVPLPLSFDPGHHVGIVVQQQTGLKQNVGIVTLQLKDKLHLTPKLSLTNTFAFKNKLKCEHEFQVR